MDDVPSDNLSPDFVAQFSSERQKFGFCLHFAWSLVSCFLPDLCFLGFCDLLRNFSTVYCVRHAKT